MKRKLTVELDENTTQVLNVTEAFKGSNKDLEDIAHDLTANHIRFTEIDESGGAVLTCSKCNHADGSHLPFPEVWELVNGICNCCIDSFEIYQLKLKLKENERITKPTN